MQSSNYNTHGMNKYDDKLNKVNTNQNMRNSNKLFGEDDSQKGHIRLHGRESQKFYEHPMENIM